MNSETKVNRGEATMIQCGCNAQSQAGVSLCAVATLPRVIPYSQDIIGNDMDKNKPPQATLKQLEC